MDEHKHHHDVMAAGSSTHTPGHAQPADRAAPPVAPASPHAGHDGHDRAGHARHPAPGHPDHAAQYRNRFWVSLALAVPVVIMSPMFAHLLGYALPVFPGSIWVAPILGTVLFVYGGQPFLTGGWREATSRRPGMMLLISMAISVAFVASWLTTLRLGGLDLDFWWELALLVVVMLLGHWLEMRALGAASGALDALASLLPDTADRITEQGVVEVPTNQLQPGDVVLVRPGARVPADGLVIAGHAHLDESMVTGESRPVRRDVGDRVIAGTVATDNTIRARVTAVGDGTALAGIQRLVAQAQRSSSRAQALADRAAAVLFYLAVAAAIATFAAWWWAGSLAEAVTRSVTVLVIACPHALGLAIPLVIAIATERAARAGVLVKNRIALESMRTVTVVLFDKTGTLTEGRPHLSGIAAADPLTVSDVVALAAAVEADSEHPFARAIVQEAESRELSPPASSNFQALPGRGVTAMVQGHQVTVGGPVLIRELNLPVPEELRSAVSDWTSRGAAVQHLIEDEQVIGALAFADQIRPESGEAVIALHRRGIAVAMVTGDARQVAEAVAIELGIDEVFAEVLPQDKDAQVVALQHQGARVAMVGDGVNDAPALARADVGIAIGAGTDVAIESAGVVLIGNDPRAVLSVIELSRASYRKMVQNLAWATGYNVLAIPLAAGVLAFAGIVVSPALGAVLMSASTIIVAINAQTLRRLDLDPVKLSRT